MAAARAQWLESQDPGGAAGPSSDCDALPASAARPAAAAAAVVVAAAGLARPSSLESDSFGADRRGDGCVTDGSRCAGEHLLQALQAKLNLDDTDLESIERSLLTVREF